MFLKQRPTDVSPFMSNQLLWMLMLTDVKMGFFAFCKIKAHSIK